MFLCSYCGGETRDHSSSSPLRTIGPAQPGERVRLKREEVTQRGGAFVGSRRERRARVSKRSNERRNECFVKRVECVEIVALEACS